ncbi:hypothetical protein Taro_003023 [Colocasia esculenta]|uniref:DExH14 plug domain-containing protein n=1 Tax=Colocasia esculenta TaxID=4460 RepID=A0A843TI15_COLES|nr:hypothetical protein [Colocasia esculenta]
MLVQVPRLTSSLRGHYDVDQAYLQRKSFLRDYRGRRLYDDSELARKLVPGWEEASSDVRQAYRQYLGAVVELVNGEVVQEEFQEIAKNVYDLLSSIYSDSAASKQIMERKGELERLIGYSISESHLKKVALSAQRLSELQHNNLETLSIKENTPDVAEDESVEFGSDLAFQAPARFLVDMSLESGLLWENETSISSFSNMEEDKQLWSRSYQFSTSNETVNLRWLRDACDLIVEGGGSQLSADELAMALCRVLESNKAGDEIAADLLDLVGDGAIETVQELLQVTIQTEAERQIDKLRRKEEKRHKRGADHANVHDLGAESFFSLLQASERKQLFDDIIGTGQGSNSVPITALPQGTTRSHHSGYEEVRVPPTPTAPMRPDEKLRLALIPVSPTSKSLPTT